MEVRFMACIWVL